MASFAASLVTPERVVLEVEVQAVMLRTADGDATFLPGHTDLVGAIVPGLVRFEREDGTVERAAVHGGFVQVEPEHVVVLAPVAELASEIDVERARRALDEADAQLSQLGGASVGASSAAGADDAGGVSVERLEADAARRRAEVRLEVAGVSAAS